MLMFHQSLNLVEINRNAREKYERYKLVGTGIAKGSFLLRTLFIQITRNVGGLDSCLVQFMGL